ncbi:NSS family neurotransmitter:Na+ symporter [Clostridium tetanomorphum]|uniref:Transporter n=1 Tax=Clostridium tetanomorphum TaxID=1553 RepID=A0A923ECF5_CLOTT|nr:sodium-dependent transporter [Clostridium tetanomorphum]KAJ49963.1 sodium- and chloride-dependent transporter, TnaT [Clostridium tetanomorphum DSM 665]MBC2399289.1 sodium-dependent transporter [Clostridium tetanomorphum]MBP1866093.1 NSS family neurotransmitter:Na+ symporter [Clostridium tetanomorphum]NRS86721.1 NSS family neurotransmitter:Na+ symporter [Clostridium tetanomorphum]NRZ99526.1 NSS family neurotransmitter:Na+ symporter [Clostridium tetanomorphum]
MANDNRDQWGSRFGFIMATIGAAIGLGNLWRFPFMAYQNGGGAFLLPYFVAVLTAGIPLMILEFGFGSKMKGASTLAFAKLGKRWEWLGWWPVMIPLIVVTFYSVIIAWSINYFILSFGGGWGSNPNKFFSEEFLRVSNGPWNFVGIRWNIAIAVMLVWFLNYYITKKGISSGIERACKIITPTLAVLMILMTIRGLTLPGAANGLNWFLKPDFTKIANGKVWIAAYAQVFFSTTLAVGVMTAYASYLPPKSDIVNNAFITVFSNASFDFMAGLCVFSILGYAAYASNLPIDKIVAAGPGIAFIAFPNAINLMPGGIIIRSLIGAIFFFCLIIAGISSSISMVEAFASAALDKYNLSREKMIRRICLPGFIASMLFSTCSGIHILDIVDHFVSNYGIALIGLVEVIVLGYVYKTERMRREVNEYSDIKIGVWWDFLIRYITPILLGYMSIDNIITEFKAPYGGYTMSSLIVFGWSIAIGILIMGIYLSRKPWPDENILKINS